MSKVFIYGLYTSSDDTIRYVGKCENLSQRLKMHYSQRNSSKTYKNNWISKSISSGDDILIRVLEEVDSNNWIEKEIEWINKIPNLTNTSSGGLGGSGKIYNISYIDCKNIINEFGIKSKTEWFIFTKCDEFPKNIPKNPRQFFKSEWVSWGDFLGTNRKRDNIMSNIYIDYTSCKIWVNNNLSIKSRLEWKKNIENLPIYIPKRPERFYKNRGWLGWPDFLCKDRIANQHRSFLKFEDAKNIIDKLNITTIKEYKNIQKMYQNELPVHPHLTYKNKGFTNYGEFFKRL
jgi:hypothetical protein